LLFCRYTAWTSGVRRELGGLPTTVNVVFRPNVELPAEVLQEACQENRSVAIHIAHVGLRIRFPVCNNQHVVVVHCPERDDLRVEPLRGSGEAPAPLRWAFFLDLAITLI
jgi:hypothetical protein